MIDTYAKFEDLAVQAVEGTDFRIVARKKDGPFLIMAIHGGNIEPFTSEVAMAIAGDEHGLYLFEGLRELRNDELHIGSEYFDEPQAKDIVRSVDVVISVHAHHEGGGEFMTIGGLCMGLIEKMKDHISAIDISIQSPDPRFHADHPDNICNRGMSGGGVQIEMSKALRDALKEDAGLFRLFTNAIRHAIAAYHI